jgi:type II secretory pathway predicted ATPase ExeA
MYKSFFKLQSNPFAGSPDPRFLYMMPHTREALATLEYGISAHKGFIVLTGEVGTGKTKAGSSARSFSILGSMFSTFWSSFFRISGSRRRTEPSRAC